MPHDDIPNLLGRVLSGTKYGVKQTRGKFGLGAKMALIWSKMSTGLPIEIWSAMRDQSYVSHYKLDIDIHKYSFIPIISSACSQCCLLPLNLAVQRAALPPGLLALWNSQPSIQDLVRHAKQPITDSKPG